MAQGSVELRKSRVFDVLYTGGDYVLSSSGDTLFTTCGNLIKALRVEDGSEKYTVGDKDQESRVTSFALKEDDSEIVVAYASDVIKRYSLAHDTCTLLHQFRGTHNAPILVLKWLTINKEQELSILASGSADFSVKVWDMKAHYCTHNFRGKFVVTALCFVNEGRRLLVGYGEGLVRMINLKDEGKEKKTSVEWDHHTSRITAIFLSTNKFMHGMAVFSRDKSVSLLNTRTLEVKVVIQLHETIENAVFIGGDDARFITVGEEGILKVWSFITGKAISETRISRAALENIVYCKSSDTVICASVECDLLQVDVKTLSIVKQFAGYNDEIFDVSYVSKISNCLAVASNAADLRLYNLSSYSCHLVQGHSESILSVDSPDWNDFLLATGSKDNSVMLWKLSNGIEAGLQFKMEEPLARNIAVATGHTNSVSSVRFSHSKTRPFIVSVSNDATLKIWPLESLKEDDQEIHKLTASSTFVAHSKAINSVDVSSNDMLCVTASMDKTAKLWHINKNSMEFGIAGTLEGHKRGVWSARFSKNLQTVATCSGDCTIKIFSLLDKACLHTLSGHSFAVLSVLFINKSSKLLSADGGGLLKIWDIEKGVCEKTIEAHTDKIWSLEPIDRLKKEDVGGDDPDSMMEYVTVGADGQMIVWDDVSKEIHEELMKERAKKLADNQSLSNFIEQAKFVDAVLLTLDLAQPFKCLSVINKILERDDGKELVTIFKALNPVQLSILLDYASQWNTNTRTYSVSQTLLNHALRNIPPDEFLRLPNIDSLVKAFLPYSNRHYDRLTNIRMNVSHLNYIFSRMRL